MFDRKVRTYIGSLVTIGVVLGGLVFFIATRTVNSPTTLVAQYAPRLGYLAPDFSLIDMDGKEVKLSDYRGKPVLINFWATWCPPCRAEMPEIEAAYRVRQKDSFVVLGVDAREDQQTVQRYVSDNGYSWLFPLDSDGSVLATYGVKAFPTSFFVDRQGYIQATQIGGMDKKGLEDRLARILGG